MTQLDSEAWLERAREALSPGEADQARVLAALEKQLHLPRSARSSHEASGLEAERSNSIELAGALKKLTPARLSAFKWRASSTLWRYAVSALVPLAGVAAISVFVATRSSGPTSPPVQRQAARPVAAALTQPSLPDALELALAQADVKETKAVERPQAVPEAKPSEKKPARKKCRAANGSERPCTTSKPGPSALADAAPPSAAAPAGSLSQELAALRGAQQALRKGQPAQALELLTRFERESKGPGAMQEERSAAATMARCALAGSNHATSELYAAFTQRYPNSAYAARVRRLCSAKP